MSRPQMPDALRPAQFAPAIAWLRSKGVPPARIGDAFSITENYVRGLTQRGRHARGFAAPIAGLGSSVEDRTGVVTPSRTLDSLEQALDALRREWAVERRDYPAALRAHRAFRPRMGRPGSTAMNRILAQWYAQCAWFAAHGGLTRSATTFSKHARALYATVYGESGDRKDLKSLADVLLVESHAHLHVNQPERSDELLADFKAASERLGIPLGSDYYRQLGLAYALTANTDDADRGAAERLLAKVPIVMQRVGDAETANDRLLAGRQQYLMGKVIDVDHCIGLADVAQHSLEVGGMRWIISMNYCAAGQISLGPANPEFERGLETLERLAPLTRNEPMQGAIGYLLALTPRLRLDDPLRSMWVRQIFYLNPHYAG